MPNLWERLLADQDHRDLFQHQKVLAKKSQQQKILRSSESLLEIGEARGFLKALEWLEALPAYEQKTRQRINKEASVRTEGGFYNTMSGFFPEKFRRRSSTIPPSNTSDLPLEEGGR